MFTANPVGLTGCIISGTAIAAIKVLQVAHPAFMQKDNLFTRIVKDSRTPLRLLGLSMLTVMSATLVQNAADLWSVTSSLSEFISKGWISTVLPAIASGAYSICNFRFAAAIGAAKDRDNASRASPGLAAEKNMGRMKLMALRPETYMSIGTIALGLTTGGASLLCLPLLISGYTIALKNIIRKREPHVGHPNMHFVGVRCILSGVGFAAANPSIGIAYLISMGYLVRIEGLITPGGFKQVVRDMKEDADDLLQKMAGKKKIISPERVFSRQPVLNKPSSMLASADPLRHSFDRVQAVKPQETAVQPKPVAGLDQ